MTLIFHILGIIIPTDEFIFFKGVETTNQLLMILKFPLNNLPFMEFWRNLWYLLFGIEVPKSKFLSLYWVCFTHIEPSKMGFFAPAKLVIICST